MLLKYSNSERRLLIPAKSVGNTARGTGMRMTMATASTMTPRIHRKVLRIPSKRYPGKALPGKLHSISRVGVGKLIPGKRIHPRPISVCDNSNDSGLGLDQHVEVTHHSQPRVVAATRSKSFEYDATSSSVSSAEEESDSLDDQRSEPRTRTTKCRKIEQVQIDDEDACSDDVFAQKIATTMAMATATQVSYVPSKYITAVPSRSIRPGLKRMAQQPINTSTSSKNGTVYMEIIQQPEQQHRARYQTEGSRGAVKDRSGNGFPIVKLTGYSKPAVLQVFIGTDIGRVAPHMFYQACKVAGKNSTPCIEKKVEGTMIIEIEFKQENEMTITCDCVGILKERNVDVEHRFPDHTGQRSKKKSTRCRMVFRTQLQHDDGSSEILQVCSHPIVCTQPPGVPEICKKSLSSCPVEGGLELFIIGKNFLKDTRVIFQSLSEESSSHTDIGAINVLWEETVLPDKEFLQQTHLICNVPPYINQNITKPVQIQICVMSSGKRSETHYFLYTPRGMFNTISAAAVLGSLPTPMPTRSQESHFVDESSNSSNSMLLWGTSSLPDAAKEEADSGMMPPPTSFPPAISRRASTSGNLLQEQLTLGLKAESMDENSQGSLSGEQMSTPMSTDSAQSQFSVHSDSSHDSQSPISVGTAVSSLASPSPSFEAKQAFHQVQIDIGNAISILNQTGTLAPFQSHENHTAAAAAALDVVNMAVKQEQMAAALLTTAQNNQSIEKYISSLEAENNAKLEQNVEANMFVSPNENANSVFTDHIQSLVTTSSATLQSDFTRNILDRSNNSPSAISQILNITPEGSGPSSLVNGIHPTAITQDIILNSQPAASINSVNMQMITSGSGNGPNQITSELILNPTVSPTVMCQPTTDSGSLLNNHPVTMANNILNDMNITAQPTHADNLMNNLMMNSVQDQLHRSHKAGGVSAVDSMVLNAAAEFIIQQDPIINTGTTINALMSLTANPILSEPAATTVQQILNIATAAPQATSCTQKADSMGICTSQNSLNQHHLSLYGPASQTLTSQLMNNSDPTSNQNDAMDRVNVAVPLETIVSATAGKHNGFLNDIHKQNQIVTTISSSKTQESLLQAVSLVRNDMENSKISNAINLENVTQAAGTVATTFPQEITTMSDQDLLSYINTSCFDQV